MEMYDMRCPACNEFAGFKSNDKGDPKCEGCCYVLTAEDKKVFLSAAFEEHKKDQQDEKCIIRKSDEDLKKVSSIDEYHKNIEVVDDDCCELEEKYFVLRPERDQASLAALEVFASICGSETLKEDILNVVSDIKVRHMAVDEINQYIEKHGIVSWDCSSQEVEYVAVDLTDELRVLMDKYGHDFDEDKVNDETYDITHFAFENAEWFDGKKFSLVKIG